MKLIVFAVAKIDFPRFEVFFNLEDLRVKPKPLRKMSPKLICYEAIDG